MSPAGIQASRIPDLWNLTLAVCCVVFAAILVACLIAILPAPRANRATPADIPVVSRAQAPVRFRVSAATGVSAFLLFGLVLATCSPTARYRGCP
ncbi:hypothetical protein [Caballeronia sp. S22]|uniref:hypothetical protein n=1 Tax=Caballeronia sp. S22 TaxID=3137182 RepID=UPI0035311B30